MPQSKRKDTREALVRAAMAWFHVDRPEQGKPSGLRILTTGSVWNPTITELRLARACARHAATKRRKP